MLRWVWVPAIALVVLLALATLVVPTSSLPDWLEAEVIKLPLLRPGDEGEWVVRLQDALAALGINPGPVNGRLGPMTQEAVKRFQSQCNLAVDGLVGSDTWQALTAALLQSQSSPTDRERPAAEDEPLESIPAPGPIGDADDDRYVVQPGDTLFSISRRLGISVHELIRLNDIGDPDLIKAGQVLLITSDAPADGARPDPVEEADQRTWHEGGWFTYLPPTPASTDDPPSGDERDVQAEPAPAPAPLALTFNDGPDRTVTGRILEVLAVESVRATFFVIGTEVAANPNLVRRMMADGHQVENHSYTHPDFTTDLSWGGMRAEISRAADLIKSLTGRRPRYFRPPYGSWDHAVAMAAARESHAVVLWSNIGAGDLPFPGADELAKRLNAMAFPGGIIMLHATLPDTAETLPSIISTLRGRGFEFVTLDELPSDELPGLLFTGD